MQDSIRSRGTTAFDFDMLLPLKPQFATTYKIPHSHEIERLARKKAKQRGGEIHP